MWDLDLLKPIELLRTLNNRNSSVIAMHCKRATASRILVICGHFKSSGDSKAGQKPELF